jgi:hypothetical protein
LLASSEPMDGTDGEWTAANNQMRAALAALTGGRHE